MSSEKHLGFDLSPYNNHMGNIYYLQEFYFYVLQQDFTRLGR